MSKEISLIFKCNNCGNQTTLESNQRGHQVQFSTLLRNGGFRMETPSIDLDGDIEDLRDVSDVDAEINNIEIYCKKCGTYIRLEDFRA